MPRVCAAGSCEVREDRSEPRWRERAGHAKKFLEAMWDDKAGKFWAGTQDDGATVNTAFIPLDVQAWAVLALRDDAAPYVAAIEFSESNLKVGDGYDFNEDLDGIWYEGVAQMALAYAEIGDAEKNEELLLVLESTQSVANEADANLGANSGKLF